MKINVLCIGDIVGRPGRRILAEKGEQTPFYRSLRSIESGSAPAKARLVQEFGGIIVAQAHIDQRVTPPVQEKPESYPHTGKKAAFPNAPEQVEHRQGKLIYETGITTNSTQ